VLLLVGVVAEAIFGSVSAMNTLLVLQGVSYIRWMLTFQNNSDDVVWLTTIFHFSYLKIGQNIPT